MSDLQKWKRNLSLTVFTFCCLLCRGPGAVILLGRTNMFRFNHPKEAAKLREKRKVRPDLLSVCLLEKQEVRLNLVSDKTVWVMLLTLWLFIFLSLRVACSLHSASLWQICPSPVKTCPLWCSTTLGECMNTQITAAACDYQLRPCSASPLCIRTLDSSQAICI